MRILFLTYSFLPAVGGVERSVDNLARHLAREGHRVTIATHRATALPFRYRGGDVALLHLHIPAQDRQVRWRRAATAVLNAWNLLVLALYCRTRGVEVVHGHHLNADTLYGPRLARWLGIPFVLTIRGGETEEWAHANPRRPAYLESQLSSADAVTAVSASLLRGAAEVVPSIGARAGVVPNPVDPGAVVEEAGGGAGAAERRGIVFVGRLAPMKNVELLLEAYALALDADRALPDDLWIVGDGPSRASLEARARAIGAGRIHFEGARPRREALARIRSARALVLPSRCSEGCPNVVLEAMSLGTPVLVSDLPSLVEWVADGETGSSSIARSRSRWHGSWRASPATPACAVCSRSAPTRASWTRTASRTSRRATSRSTRSLRLIGRARRGDT